MSNPFHETLARRMAVQQAAVADVTDDDMASIIRMIAIGCAAKDDQSLDKYAAAGPALREQIEASLDLVLAEQQAALEQRRRKAGVIAATDAPRQSVEDQSTPEPEAAPAATTPASTAYVAAPGCPPRLDNRGELPPPGTEVTFGRPPRPVRAPEFTNARYGLKTVSRDEANTGTDWMGRR